MQGFAILSFFVMELTTPALLFPAISLLLLAYTNRFLVLAQLIRQLHSSDRDYFHVLVHKQITNLRQRIALIRLMQALGVSSFIVCTLSMFSLFVEQQQLAEVLFGLSLVLLIASLLTSLYEIAISTQAIEAELADISAKGRY
jgi:small-conductance mechanosensitive channel